MEINGYKSRSSRRKQGKYIQPAVRQEMYGELREAEAAATAVTVLIRRNIAVLENAMKVYLVY